MPSTLTVCICTYNRCESLKRTLESLFGQKDLGSDVEVLIVDNNCIDDTQRVVESFRDKLAIRRVTENRQGLSPARNRAVTEFRSNLLLFVDDDMTFGPRWLSAYLDAACRYPEAEYFGGRILPDWQGAKPSWVGDKPLPLIEGVLGWYDHGTETRPYRSAEPPPIGGNFAVRRRLFDRISPFRVELGTGGAGLGLGEETELFMRAQNAGSTGVYVGEALCLHAFEQCSLTMRELFRYGTVVGRSQIAIAARPYVGSYPKAADFLIRGLYQLWKGRGDLFRQCIINAGVEVGSNRACRSKGAI